MAKALKSGRPDIPRLLQAAAAAAEAGGHSRVAVMVCGPRKLMEDVARACDAHNSGCLLGGKKVLFDYHHETFDL